MFSPTHNEPTTMILLAIGAQVVHNGHGPGVVVGYNTATGFYTGRRYPYVIEFASGFKEVYSNYCVEPALQLPAPAWVKCYTKYQAGEAHCFPWSKQICETCPSYLEASYDDEERELEGKIEHLFTEGRMEVVGDDQT